MLPLSANFSGTCLAALPSLQAWEWVLLGVPLYLCFFSAVLAVIAWLGGWHCLAKHYRRAEETSFRLDTGSVERFGRSSLKMGPPFFPTNYGNCVTVTIEDDGMGLRVWPLFRPFHPPLLIPWNAIEGCTLDRELRLFDRAAIVVAGFNKNPLRVYGQAGRAVASAWAARQAG